MVFTNSANAKKIRSASFIGTIAFCGAVALGCFTCTDKAFFNGDEFAWNFPYAFVAGNNVRTVSINDTAGLANEMSTTAGTPVRLIGLITNPNPGIALKAEWFTSRETFGIDTIDNSFLLSHAFADTGRFTVYFRITDRMGNSLSDSVTVVVSAALPPEKTVSVDSLKMPANGEKVDPNMTGGILFVWKITKGDRDTVTARLLFGADSLSLAPVISGITTQHVYLQNAGLDSGKTYFWRIIADGPGGASDTSVIYSFTTSARSQNKKGPIIRSIRSDTTISVKDSIAFFANVIDSGARITQHFWNFGDGVSDTGATCRHAFGDTGAFKVTLRVTDSIGLSAADTVFIKVVPKKGPIILNATHDAAVYVADTVKFFAEAIDSHSTIVEYAWDFDGNGTFEYKSATSATAYHTFGDTGKYKAVLLIRDADSLTAYDTAIIFVMTKTHAGGPLIWDKRKDTTVTIGDSARLYVHAVDSSQTSLKYEWDFDGNGTVDYRDSLRDSCKHVYYEPGNYKVIVKVTDSLRISSADTIKISVRKIKLRLKAAPHDTVVNYMATVRASVAVDSTLGKLNFEIDTAHNGNYIAMADSGSSARFAFTTDTASQWDSVKLRIFTSYSDTLVCGYRVDIRPRALLISSIDSTETSISVNWTKTKEADFREYRLYRSSTEKVDTTSELAAIITQAGTQAFSTPANYLLAPAYYRVYQRDTEGLLDVGSNIVLGRIKNAPPSAPVFITPSKAGDTLWTNGTVRWNKCSDPNGDAVVYDVLMNRNSTGFATYATGLNDTFYQLNGFDTVTFRADFKIQARDSRGASSLTDRSGVLCKQVRLEFKAGNAQIVLPVIPKGSFVDSNGLRANISYDYFMTKVEITQLMFKEALGNSSNPSASVDDRQPVENVNWYRAILFCNAMSKKCNLDTAYSFSRINGTGSDPSSLSNLQCNFNLKAFRLATDDEWEMAAHGGKAYAYGTDDGTLACTKANYKACNIGHPAPAGNYPANPYGIQDLTGNVWEWCWDEFVAPNTSGRDNNRVDYVAPAGSGSGRILRGGDFDEDNLAQLSAFTRNPKTPSGGTERVGFRCVIPMKQW